MLPAAFQALGAFSVLGGNLPSLFVGCRVSVEVEGAHGLTSREQASAARTAHTAAAFRTAFHTAHTTHAAPASRTCRLLLTRQVLLVKWDGAEDSDAQLSELRLMSVYTLQAPPLPHHRCMRYLRLAMLARRQSPSSRLKSGAPSRCCRAAPRLRRPS